MIGVSPKGRKLGRICPARKLRVRRLSCEVRKVGTGAPKCPGFSARGRDGLLFGLKKPASLLSPGARVQRCSFKYSFD